MTTEQANRRTFGIFPPDSPSKHAIPFKKNHGRGGCNHLFCLMTSPTHAKCTLSGYLKHLNDSYPPTGKEHSLLCCRACLLLKPPFWKNKTGYHGDATGSSHRVSGYRCVYFPDHVDSGCLLKTQVQLWRSRSSYGT